MFQVGETKKSLLPKKEEETGGEEDEEEKIYSRVVRQQDGKKVTVKVKAPQVSLAHYYIIYKYFVLGRSVNHNRCQPGHSITYISNLCLF